MPAATTGHSGHHTVTSRGTLRTSADWSLRSSLIPLMSIELSTVGLACSCHALHAPHTSCAPSHSFAPCNRHAYAWIGGLVVTMLDIDEQSWPAIGAG